MAVYRKEESMRNLVKYAGIGLLVMKGLRPVITMIQKRRRSAAAAEPPVPAHQ